MKLYSILDVKVGSFNDPFSAHNDATAQRSFISSLTDEHAPASVRLHREDYSLYCVGDFCRYRPVGFRTNAALDYIWPVCISW